MKRLIKIFLMLIFILGCSERESNFVENDLVDFNPENSQLSGKLEGVLSEINSPYHVIGDIFVDSLSTLEIEPGVRLQFYDSTSFEVYGSIKCEGTKNNPIIFTSFQNNWEGFQIFNSNQKVNIVFTVFENIINENRDTCELGAVNIVGSDVIIQNVIFRNNFSQNGGGLSIVNSVAEIKNSIFDDNAAEVFGGAFYLKNSKVIAINNTFFSNNTGNLGGSVVLMDFIEAEFQNNLFYENSARTSNADIAIVSGDSTKFIEAYNFFGNETLDPKFISDENLHLLGNSPCINAGNPDQAFTDFDNTRNDQGAYGGPLGDW